MFYNALTVFAKTIMDCHQTALMKVSTWVELAATQRFYTLSLRP
jgi:hypothetical protein